MPTLVNQGLRDPALEGLVKVPGPPEVEEIDDLRGSWPRMLVLDDETESRLTQYLSHEISQCWQERNLLVEDWIQWQKDYWAKPDQAVRNFPFKRAANVVIPMTAIAVEAVYARLLNTLFSVKPFWSIRPRSKDWIDASPEVEKWLQTEVEDINSLDAYGFCTNSLLEVCKLGTGIGKSGYEKDIRKVNIDVPGGTSEQRWITRKNGATLDYVPCANFLLRLNEQDPQLAPLVGEEHNGVSWAQMKREALSGRIISEALEDIRTQWTSQKGETASPSTKLEDVKNDLMSEEPTWNETFNFQEIWLSFDVDGDGVDEEIVVDFHHASNTILSIRYNWYSDLHRPYRIGTYMPVEGRWAGIGIGKQNEQFQPLITTVHRQRLDAGTLANMCQLAIKKTSGYGPGEPIFPGKMWFLDDVADIKEFSLSNHQHFSQIQNEDAARQYSEKRTGVNELVLGMPHSGTPGTATTDLAKLAEGNKKFDMVLKNVKRWVGQLGSDVVQNFQQFGNQDRHWITKGQDGKWVEQFLTLPVESVRKGAAVELTVTDSVTNKDVEQQKWQGLFALLTQHYNQSFAQAIQVLQITQNPTLFLMMADMSMRASNEAIRRLMVTFNVPDIENFVLDLRPPTDAQLATLSAGGAGPPQIGAGTPTAPGGSSTLPTIGAGS